MNDPAIAGLVMRVQDLDFAINKPGMAVGLNEIDVVELAALRALDAEREAAKARQRAADAAKIHPQNRA